MTGVFLRHVLRGFRLHPGSSLGVLLACFLVALQLLFLAQTRDLFFRLVRMPQMTCRMMVYLEEGNPVEVRRRIAVALGTEEGCARVRFVSRSEGYCRLSQWLGRENRFLEGVDASMLPEAFELILDPGRMSEPAEVAGRLSSLPGVSDVRYHDGVMRHFVGVSGGRVCLVWLGALLGASALLLFMSLRANRLVRMPEMVVLRLLGTGRGMLWGVMLVEAAVLCLGGTGLALLIHWVAFERLAGCLPAFTGQWSAVGWRTVLSVGVSLYLAMLCGGVSGGRDHS